MIIRVLLWGGWDDFKKNILSRGIVPLRVDFSLKSTYGYMATDSQLIEDAKKIFQLCEDVEHDNRAEALDDMRFSKLAEQWPESARRQREIDGRPCLTINKTTAIINQIVNDARQNKPSIKVHPSDDVADPLTANIYNGLIQNIQYSSNADIAYDNAVDCSVTGGFGYWMVDIVDSDDDTFDTDLRIKPIYNPFSVFGDPHSQEADGSDWNVAFVVERITKEAFQKQWKKAEQVDWSSTGYDANNDSWVAKDDLLIAEWWTRDEDYKGIVQLSDGTILDEETYLSNKEIISAIGLTVTRDRKVKSHKVTQRIITGAEILETNVWAGSIIPICPVYGQEANIEGKRYWKGIVRDMKDPCRSYNVARSTTVEVLLQSPKTPFIGPVGAFDSDKQKWQLANVNAFPYIQYDGQVPPERQPYAGPPAGLIQEAMQSAADIQSVTGLFDASMGAPGNETSGVAITGRQREGDTATFNYIDNVSRAIRHTGRILIDLIPKVYTGERMVRILGPSGKEPSTVQLGRPVTLPSGDVKVFDLSAGKYDLTVETGPSYTTRREEAANQMIDLVRAIPSAAPALAIPLVKNLDWPGADEVLESLKQLQGQDPQMQQAQQTIQQLQQQVAQFTQKAQTAQMDVSIDVEKLKIDAYNAETDRLKVVQVGMGPEDVQALVMQTLQQLLTAGNIMPGAGPGMTQPIAQTIPAQNQNGIALSGLRPQGLRPEIAALVAQHQQNPIPIPNRSNDGMINPSRIPQSPNN